MFSFTSFVKINNPSHTYTIIFISKKKEKKRSRKDSIHSFDWSISFFFASVLFRVSGWKQQTVTSSVIQFKTVNSFPFRNRLKWINNGWTFYLYELWMCVPFHLSYLPFNVDSIHLYWNLIQKADCLWSPHEAWDELFFFSWECEQLRGHVIHGLNIELIILV